MFHAYLLDVSCLLYCTGYGHNWGMGTPVAHLWHTCGTPVAHLWHTWAVGTPVAYNTAKMMMSYSTEDMTMARAPMQPIPCAR